MSPMHAAMQQAVRRGAALPGRGRTTAAAAAYFSTTAAQAKLKNVPPRRERAAAAASELGALSGLAPSEAAPAAVAAEAKDAAPKVSQFLKNDPGGADTSSVSTSSSSSPPPGAKIINLRSLPRRLPRSPRFPGPSGVSSSFASSLFQARLGGGGQAKEGGGGGPGRAGGAGRRAAGAGGGPRGQRRKGVRRRKGQSANGDEGRRASAEDEGLTEAEQAWMEARELGPTTVYEPTLTRESLLGYGPAVATSWSPTAGAGNRETVLRAMRLLGDGTAFCNTIINPDAARDRLMRGETVFFDTVRERAAVEAALRSKRALRAQGTKEQSEQALHAQGTKEQKAAPSLITPVSAATKTAILEAAVRGVYAPPSAADPDPTAQSPLRARLQRYQAKESTYTTEQAQRFDAKLDALVPATL